MSLETWTVIVCADDCTSVQTLLCEAENPEAAARKVFAAHAWLADFRLIAAARGTPKMFVRDDARTAEYGLEP